MTSIRRHLTRRMVAGTFLIAAGGLVTIFVYLHVELTEQFDNTLLSRARTLGSLVQFDQTDGRLELELTERAMAEYRVGRRPDYFELYAPGGEQVIARSDSLHGVDLARPPEGTPFDGRKRFFYLTLPDGRRGRAIDLLVEPGYEREGRGEGRGPTDRDRLVRPDAPPVLLTLASDLAEVDEAFFHVLGVLLIVLAAVSVATVFTVVRTVRRGLRPLRDIGDAVARIDPATLASRLDVAALPDELRPIAEKLNELLARLDDAFQRERRFTSNVAHELRTPIAELRSLAEVALRFPGDDAAGAAEDYGDVLAIARQMESVVSALLAVARSQAGREAVTLGAVDVREAVREAWRHHAPAALARGLRVGPALADQDAATLPPAVVRSDATALNIILGNLVANAAAYAPARGRVWCEGRARGDRYVLEVLNDNDSLAEADLPLLTEPFWQKDSSRTHRTNSGLGMALVATYAGLLNAPLAFELRSGGGVFAVTLELPLASPDDAGDTAATTTNAAAPAITNTRQPAEFIA